MERNICLPDREMGAAARRLLELYELDLAGRRVRLGLFGEERLLSLEILSLLAMKSPCSNSSRRGVRAGLISDYSPTRAPTYPT